MNYKTYVKDIFLEHQNCMGQSIEEAEDIFNETKFTKIESWLYKTGYALKTDYAFEQGIPEQKTFTIRTWMEQQSWVTGTKIKHYRGISS